MQNLEDKIKIKEFVSIIIWSMKLQLLASVPMYILYFITRILNTILPILTSFISAQIINSLVNSLSNGSTVFASSLIIWVILLFASYTLEAFGNNFFVYSDIMLQYQWDLKIWPKYIRHSANIDFQHVESSEYNILTHKAKEGMDWRTINFNKKIAEFTAGILGLLLIGGILVSLNIILVFLIVLPTLLNFIVNKKFGRDIYGFWDDHGETKTHSWYAQHALENKDVLREAKIYRFADFIVKKYTDAQQVFVDTQGKKVKKKYFYFTLISGLSDMTFVLIQVWLIFQVLNRFIKLGDYSFYVNSLNGVSRSIGNIENSISSMLEYIRYTRNLKMFFELSELVIKSDNNIILERIAPTIEFKNVSFKYPTSTNYVLKNASFILNPGQKVALVGENGAGKTTLIKLMARFYDVTEGEILINGHNIKNIDIDSYYKLWGVLFQSFAKFWFSVKENIGIGNVSNMENDAQIHYAAEKSGADKFIHTLKHEYDNYLTNDLKDGLDLSGGQWQKLGIARSIFADPKFIILDEPTSALDALAEKEVFENINSISKDTTIVMVSHRFATVRQADKILVLENGEITEQGTHGELMEKQGLYYKMFSTQAEGYK